MIKADALLGRVTMNTNGGIGIGQLLFSCYTRIKDFLYNFFPTTILKKHRPVSIFRLCNCIV